MNALQSDYSLCLLNRRAGESCSGQVKDIEYLFTGDAIAIRGTEADRLLSGFGFLDVVRDVRILPWYDRRIGWAHAGMLKGALALWEETEHLFSRHRVSVTGHSMGAGIGLLLSHLLVDKGVPVRFVGFGTPRCMISKVDPRIDATFYRNGDDFVTDVPRWWMGGYRQLPVVQLADSYGFPSLYDHRLDNYLASMRALVVASMVRIEPKVQTGCTSYRRS